MVPVAGTVAEQFSVQPCAAVAAIAAVFVRAATQCERTPSSAIPMAKTMRIRVVLILRWFLGFFITGLLFVLHIMSCEVFSCRRRNAPQFAKVFPQDQINVKLLVVNLESGGPVRRRWGK